MKQDQRFCFTEERRWNENCSEISSDAVVLTYHKDAAPCIDNWGDAVVFFSIKTKVLRICTVNGATDFFSPGALETGAVFRATIEPDS